MFYNFFLFYKFKKFSANIFICLISQVDIKCPQILILSESLKTIVKKVVTRASQNIASKHVSLHSNRCVLGILK